MASLLLLNGAPCSGHWLLISLCLKYLLFPQRSRWLTPTLPADLLPHGILLRSLSWCLYILQQFWNTHTILLINYSPQLSSKSRRPQEPLFCSLLWYQQLDKYLACTRHWTNIKCIKPEERWERVANLPLLHKVDLAYLKMKEIFCLIV